MTTFRLWIRRLLAATAAMFVLIAVFTAWILVPPTERRVTFPEGKRFAFTIVDDTDLATLERNRPVYEVLRRYGLRTTKTAWALPPTELDHLPNAGDTLADKTYRDFLLGLRNHGFEIALHGVRGGSSTRADVVAGLEEFRRVFGSYPTLHINHSENRDNLYWGQDRWTFGPLRWLYALSRDDRFSGDEAGSPYFWGDLAERHVRYVNQFTFEDINLLNVTPAFPYHLPDKPRVNFWFPTSNGNNLDMFESLLSKANLDRLEREGGICVVYSHLGSGSFNAEGGVNPRFEARIRDVASRSGWFVPATELLDYLASQPGWQAQPSWRERVRLEFLFLWEVVTH